VQNGNDILDRIGQLKPLLSDRYEKYTADKASTPTGAMSSGASASSAAQRARSERADAARYQAEENAAAQRRHEEDARRQADRDAKRRAAEDESRRRAEADAQAQAQKQREEEEATRWNLQQLESSLQASTSAAARQVQQHQQQQRAIAYIPPVIDDMYLPQPHSLTRPHDDDSASEFGSSSLANRTGLPQPQPGHPPPRGYVVLWPGTLEYTGRTLAVMLSRL